MKTDGSRLTRPRTGLGSGPPRVGTATLRPAGFQVPRTSAQHHLTPRIRLPAAWLENKFLVPPPGARAGLPKPTLRFSQPLDPRLPLGLGAWRGGPHSLAHKPDPRQLEPGCQPESRAEGTIDSREQAWEVPAELPELLPAYDLSNEDYEDLVQARVDLADEELQDVADPSQNRDAVLRRKKVQLLNEVCCSLIKGGNLAEKEDETRERLQVLCEEIAQQDPEFLLKVALYTRQELNIRSTANFLLALSAWLLPSRPHLRRYFCQAVRLPSDWIEVARLYQSLASNTGSLAPYPSCLRQSLSDRFKGFDEYQLAKYNSRKQRCKNCSKRLQRSSLTANETNPKTPFSLKKLVRWLHLKEPAYHVMCLLGRRYPADLQSFSRSRLPGPWDSRRAGKRMKFELPESWERQLSLHGNTAAVWEQLIDHQKLPFMAMLRNLRNMIAAGISTPHHSQLLRRLTDKDSVIRSRQFPFRFLAAYQALNELQRRLDEKDEPLPTKAALVQKALESLRLPRRRMQFLARSRAAPLQFRGKRIEFVHQWATKKLEDLRKSRIVRYDREILERYRRALAAAVEISASHNMSPLPGRTAVLCSVSHNMTQPCVSAKGLYVPRTRTKEEEDQAQIRRSPMILDVAILLALMAHHVSEHAQLILFNNDTYREIQLESGTVLSNVDRVLQEAKSLQESESASFDGPSGTVAFMMDCIQNHTPIDTIFQLDCFYNYNIKEAVQLYRYHVNPDTLFVLVQMSAFHCSIEDEADSKDVILGGYSEQILRFLCERGSARLLEHVEGIDEVFQLPRARGDRGRKRRKLVEPMASNPLLQTPTLRWRTVRVFVSSTFRDMCSERDLLIRSVFPELRARAARHFVRVEEVDLRWGITEEESRSNRQLELCLTEVSRCQLFVGILGERYGQILSEYPLPDLPQFEWVKSYPRNRSITELEIMQFLRLHDNSPSEHAFFYTRDPAVLRSLPETWMSDFASESEEARARVTHLKGHVKEAGLLVLENYRSELGADVSGRPFLKGLEEFGTSVLDRLWKAIVSQYCQADCSPAPDEDAFQGAFREAQARQHHGRLRQLEGTALSIRDRRAGGLLVVHGKHGQGKTAFMASLITLLSGGSVEHSPGRSHLLFHFTGATETATDAAGTLHRLCRLLTAQLKDRHEPLPQSYRGLVLEFHSLLENFAHRHPRGHLILLVDGADCIQTRNNQRTSDWIPETVPHRVTLVLSVTEDSPLHQALATRKGLVPVHLGPLEPLDRSEIVRRYLAIFGKKLEESAFNNQMRQLVMKKESHNPLFLKLASDDLREFGVFEKVSDQIRALPPTLRGLIQHALGCLEREQGQDVVTVALGALYVSTKGLRERDLYCVLCTSRGLPTGSASPSWEEVMEEAEKPRRPVPMASFARLMRSLRSILGIWTPPAEMPTSRLRLSGALLRAAVCQRYLRDARHERQLHQLLAVHLWRLIDPKGNGLFAKCDPEALSDLPQHLILCGQLSRLASLLTNLHFCHLHLQLKLLAQLNVTFNLYHAAAAGDAESEGSLPDVDPYRCFVAANWPVLGVEPTLFWQQALNQPEASPVCRQARSQLLAEDGPARKLPEGFRLVEWTNRPQAFPSQGKVMTTPTVPLCVGLSPSGRLAAVGTSEGYLHVLDLESGEETQSLASSCDGISSCVFLGEGGLCTTSFDGRIEAWGLADGCRLMLIEGHCDRITGCALSPDAKHLVTCSWDRAVKLWTVTQGKLNVALANPHPLNCVAFHPQGQLLATGSWDRTVRVWNWVTDSVVMALEGHEASVRAVCYSPSGEYLAAASLLGVVFLWSAASGTRVGSYSAHSGPVTQLRYVAEGQYLLSTGTDHQVRIWSGTLGRARGEYGTEDPSPALCLSVSQSGVRLAVGYHGERLCVFHLGTGALVAECKGPRSPVRCLQWLSGESLLASGTEDGLLRVWRLRGSQASCQHLCPGHTRAPASLSLSERFLASASDDFTVLLWTLAQLVDLGSCAEVSPACVLRGHLDSVTCCSFSPDGLHLITSSKDKNLLFWDVAALPGQISHSLLSCHRDWITGCCWSPQYVASCSRDGTVCLWDPDSRQCIRELTAQSSTFSCVSIMANVVLSACGNGDLVVWKDTGAIVTTIRGHSQRINSLVVFTQELAAAEVQCEGEQQPSELTAVTASDDGAVRLWHPLLVNEVATLTGHSAPVTGAGTAAGFPFFLTVGADRTVRLWDIPSRKDLPPHIVSPASAAENPSQCQGPVTALCWSPSGEFLVSGCRSGEVKVWRSGMALQSMQAHRKQISAVVFLAESRFAVGSYDKRVSIWDLRPQQHSPSVRMCLQSSFGVGWPVSALSALPSRRQLLVGDLRGNLTLWSPERGDWTAFQSGPFCYHFSRVMERTDGSLLAVENPRQTCLRTLRNPSPPPPPEDTESGKGPEETEHGADPDKDWEKLSLGSTVDLAPWGLSSPDLYRVSLWLTVVKESGSSPTGARSLLCADSRGSLWRSLWDPTVTPVEQPHLQEPSSWTRKQVHTLRVTAVTETEELTVTGSYDRTVRLWDRQSLKQVGLFTCQAPVLCLEANPADPSLGACGDAAGALYFLRWSSCPSPVEG